MALIMVLFLFAPTPHQMTVRAQGIPVVDVNLLRIQQEAKIAADLADKKREKEAKEAETNAQKRQSLSQRFTKLMKTLADKALRSTATAYKNALTTLTTNIAADVATAIASGNPGQAPIFHNFSSYIQDLGDAAAADALNSFSQDFAGINLCDPSSIQAKLSMVLSVGLGNANPRKPQCNLDQIKQNVREGLKNSIASFSTSFNVTTAGAGAAANDTTLNAYQSAEIEKLLLNTGSIPLGAFTGDVSDLGSRVNWTFQGGAVDGIADGASVTPLLWLLSGPWFYTHTQDEGFLGLSKAPNFPTGLGETNSEEVEGNLGGISPAYYGLQGMYTFIQMALAENQAEIIDENKQEMLAALQAIQDQLELLNNVIANRKKIATNCQSAGPTQVGAGGNAGIRPAFCANNLYKDGSMIVDAVVKLSDPNLLLGSQQNTCWFENYYQKQDLQAKLTFANLSGGDVGLALSVPNVFTGQGGHNWTGDWRTLTWGADLAGVAVQLTADKGFVPVLGSGSDRSPAVQAPSGPLPVVTKYTGGTGTGAARQAVTQNGYAGCAVTNVESSPLQVSDLASGEALLNERLDPNKPSTQENSFFSKAYVVQFQQSQKNKAQMARMISFFNDMQTKITKAKEFAATLQKDIEEGNYKNTDGLESSNLAATFSEGGNDVGALLKLKDEVNEASEKKSAAERWLSVANPFKSVRSAISLEVKTPSSVVEGTANKGFDFWQTVGGYTNDIVADTTSVFTNTLALKLIQNYILGGLNKKDHPNSGPGSLSTNATQYEPTGRPGSQTFAQQQFASFARPEFDKGGAGVDVLQELETDGIIDQNFTTAASRRMTVKEAIEGRRAAGGRTEDTGPLLDGGMIFGYDMDTVRGQDFSTARKLKLRLPRGLGQSEMMRLREANIVPIGWELAAEKIFQLNGPSYTLQQVLSCYNDPGNWSGSEALLAPDPIENDAAAVQCGQSGSYCEGSCPDGGPVEKINGQDFQHNAFYHLVDPNWVLKAPASWCELEAFTNALNPDVNTSTPYVRSSQCVDQKTCLYEKSDGTCAQYGYCTQSRMIWKFNGGTSCSPQAATCEQYKMPDGELANFLENSLSSGDCTQDVAGCQWYAADQGESANAWRADAAADQKICDVAGGCTCTTAAGTTCLVDGPSNGAPGKSTCEVKTALNGSLGDHTVMADTCVLGQKIRFDDQIKDLSQSCSAENAGCRAYATFAAAGNVLRNGSFEDGSLPIIAAGQLSVEKIWDTGKGNWVGYAEGSQAPEGDGAGDASSVIDFSTGNKTEGAKALRMNRKDSVSGGTLQAQTEINYLPAGYYQLSFKHQGPGNGNVWVLDADGASGKIRLDYYREEDWTLHRSGPVYLAGGSYMVRVNVDGNQASPTDTTGTDGDRFFDEVQLVRVAEPTAWEGIPRVGDAAITSFSAYANLPQIYQNGKVQQCALDDVGCQSYTPQDGSNSAITGQVNANADFCSASCVGYKTYKQEPLWWDTSANGAQTSAYRNLIATTARQCAGGASAVGCEEYTNLEQAAQGGENLAYYTYAQQCHPLESDSGASCSTYYTFRGSASTGYQVEIHRLVASKAEPDRPCVYYDAVNHRCADDPTGPGYDPIKIITAYNAARDACIQNPNDPACRTFYDTAGSQSEAFELRSTVPCLAASGNAAAADRCVTYRKTVADPNEEYVQSTCPAGYWNGSACTFNSTCPSGHWDPATRQCMFDIYTRNSSSCSAADNMCRAYKGNAGNVFQTISSANFEPAGCTLTAGQDGATATGQCGVAGGCVCKTSGISICTVAQGGTSCTGTATGGWDNGGVAAESPTLGGHSFLAGAAGVKSDANAAAGWHSAAVVYPKNLQQGKSYELRFLLAGRNICASSTHSSLADCPAVSLDAERVVNAQIVSDYAKGTDGNYSVYGANALVRYFHASASSGSVTNVLRPATGDAADWQPFTLGPIYLDFVPTERTAIIIYLNDGTTVPIAAQSIFVDDIELREASSDTQYLIKDSWVTPISCDTAPASTCTLSSVCTSASPGYDSTTNTCGCLGNAAPTASEPDASTCGVPAGEHACTFIPRGAGGTPGYALGCSAYKGPNDQDVYLKSFSKLCTPGAVGCTAVIDTGNSDTPYVTVPTLEYQYQLPQDYTRAIIPSEDTACRAEDTACRAFGKPQVDAASGAITGYDTVYLKDDPDKYDEILCKKSQESCVNIAKVSGSDQSSFPTKDPRVGACAYDTQLKEWQRKGANASDPGSICGRNVGIATAMREAANQSGSGEYFFIRSSTVVDGTLYVLGGRGDATHAPVMRMFAFDAVSGEQIKTAPLLNAFNGVNWAGTGFGPEMVAGMISGYDNTTYFIADNGSNYYLRSYSPLTNTFDVPSGGATLADLYVNLGVSHADGFPDAASGSVFSKLVLLSVSADDSSITHLFRAKADYATTVNGVATTVHAGDYVLAYLAGDKQIRAEIVKGSIFDTVSNTTQLNGLFPTSMTTYNGLTYLFYAECGIGDDGAPSCSGANLSSGYIARQLATGETFRGSIEQFALHDAPRMCDSPDIGCEAYREAITTTGECTLKNDDESIRTCDNQNGCICNTGPVVQSFGQQANHTCTVGYGQKTCAFLLTATGNDGYTFIESSLQQGNACNGQVNPTIGCLAFDHLDQDASQAASNDPNFAESVTNIAGSNPTSQCNPDFCYDQFTSTFEAGPSGADNPGVYIGGNPACKGAGAVPCNTTDVFQVSRDRVCSEELFCVSNTNAYDSYTGDQRLLCTGFGERPVSSTITGATTYSQQVVPDNFTTTAVGVATADAYALRQQKSKAGGKPVNFTGGETGFTIPNNISVASMAQLNLKDLGLSEDDSWILLSGWMPGGSSTARTLQAPIGQLTVDYPSSENPEYKVTAAVKTCRQYPDESSPFRKPSNVSQYPAGTANCEDGAECDCNYQEVRYSGVKTAYYGTAEQPAYGFLAPENGQPTPCAAGTKDCTPITERRLFTGVRGYCLESDPSARVANSTQGDTACALWYPASFVYGEPDPLENAPEAGWIPSAQDMYICAESVLQEYKWSSYDFPVKGNLYGYGDTDVKGVERVPRCQTNYKVESAWCYRWSGKGNVHRIDGGINPKGHDEVGSGIVEPVQLRNSGDHPVQQPNPGQQQALFCCEQSSGNPYGSNYQTADIVAKNVQPNVYGALNYAPTSTADIRRDPNAPATCVAQNYIHVATGRNPEFDSPAADVGQGRNYPNPYGWFYYQGVAPSLPVQVFSSSTFADDLTNNAQQTSKFVRSVCRVVAKVTEDGQNRGFADRLVKRDLKLIGNEVCDLGYICAKSGGCKCEKQNWGSACTVEHGQRACQLDSLPLFGTTATNRFAGAEGGLGLGSVYPGAEAICAESLPDPLETGFTGQYGICNVGLNGTETAKSFLAPAFANSSLFAAVSNFDAAQNYLLPSLATCTISPACVNADGCDCATAQGVSLCEVDGPGVDTNNDGSINSLSCTYPTGFGIPGDPFNPALAGNADHTDLFQCRIPRSAAYPKLPDLPSQLGAAQVYLSCTLPSTCTSDAGCGCLGGVSSSDTQNAAYCIVLKGESTCYPSSMTSILTYAESRYFPQYFFDPAPWYQGDERWTNGIYGDDYFKDVCGTQNSNPHGGRNLDDCGWGAAADRLQEAAAVDGSKTMQLDTAATNLMIQKYGNLAPNFNAQVAEFNEPHINAPKAADVTNPGYTASEAFTMDNIDRIGSLFGRIYRLYRLNNVIDIANAANRADFTKYVQMYPHKTKNPGEDKIKEQNAGTEASPLLYPSEYTDAGSSETPYQYPSWGATRSEWLKGVDLGVRRIADEMPALGSYTPYWFRPSIEDEGTCPVIGYGEGDDFRGNPAVIYKAGTANENALQDRIYPASLNENPPRTVCTMDDFANNLGDGHKTPAFQVSGPDVVTVGQNGDPDVAPRTAIAYQAKEGAVVTIKFFAYDETGNQMPLRNFEVNWGDTGPGHQVSMPNGSYKNFRPACNNESGARWGTTQESCRAAMKEFSYTYRLPERDPQDLTRTTLGNCTYVDQFVLQPNSCDFTIQVEVTDNWGWTTIATRKVRITR